MNEILSGAMIIVTTIYAWLTYKIMIANQESVKEMKEQYISLRRPYIVAEIYIPSSFFVYLKIKNVGKSSANNLKLILDQSVLQSGREDWDLSKKDTFSKPISSFLPSTELIFELDYYKFLFEENKIPFQFKITASYEFENKTYVDNLDIDLTPFREINILKQDEIPEFLDKLDKRLKELIEATRVSNHFLKKYLEKDLQ